MTIREVDKLIVALMIVTIMTIITTGITVSREIDRLQKWTSCMDKVTQCKK